MVPSHCLLHRVNHRFKTKMKSEQLGQLQFDLVQLHIRTCRGRLDFRNLCFVNPVQQVSRAFPELVQGRRDGCAIERPPGFGVQRPEPEPASSS